MQLRPWIAGLAAAGLLIPPGPANAEPPPKPAKGASSTHTVTLITGDKAMVTTTPGKPDVVRFQPAPGSRSKGATISIDRHRTLVVPQTAMADLAAGRLDSALFDTRALIAEQRDDARSTGLPVIVQYAGPVTTARKRARGVLPEAATSQRELTSIGARAATVPKANAADFWQGLRPTGKRVQTAISKVWLDRRTKTTLDQSVPQIGAPAAWQRGLTGKGVKVAVLDTGIDTGHADLKDKVVTSKDFSGSPDTGDRSGHGTHVASTIAGSGAGSDGKYRGVAPDSQLLNGKVLGDDGTGSMSGVIEGMEWAVAQGADVVNLSLGTSMPSDGLDPASQAINALSPQALFVVAAGNCTFTNEPESISSPAAADAALAVANLQLDGGLNPTSCQGPRYGDHALKPEIAAPGTGIVAARATGTDLGQPVDEHYTALTGTSMATPHVAGAAALLAQAQPDWTSPQLRSRLITTANPQPDDVNSQGAGRVDADQATQAGPLAETAELEFGELEAGNVVKKQLSYRNPGDQPVTLDLSTAMDGQEGPAPVLSANQLTVPAGGSASVDVTVTVRAGYGDQSGRVLAKPSTGGDPLVTTVGWFVATGLHKVTIHLTNPDGSEPSGILKISPTGDQGGGGDASFYAGGRQIVRLPAGGYDINATLSQEMTDAAPARGTLAAVPDVDISGPVTVELDGRKAKLVKTEVQDRPDVTPANTGISYSRRGHNGSLLYSVSMNGDGVGLQLAATPTPKARVGTMEYGVIARHEQPAYRVWQGRTEVGVYPFTFGPRFNGTRSGRIADGGTAGPGELDGVRGKVAVIRLTPDRPIGEQVKAAQAAGAIAVIAFAPNTPWYGVGFFEPEGATLPTVVTKRGDAQKLLDQSLDQSTVTLKGTVASPVVYELVRPFDRVPADPSLVVRQAEFATVAERFAVPGDRTRSSDARLGQTPFGAGSYTIDVPERPALAKRTSYLLGGPVKWAQVVALENIFDSDANWLGPVRQVRAGQRIDENWFTGVLNAGLPDSTPELGRLFENYGVRQYDDALAVTLAPFQNGFAGQWEFVSSASTHRLTVRRNGELIAEKPAPVVHVPIDPAAADYELSLETSREKSWWTHSTRMKSTWNWRSSGASDAMPLVLADLDVPTASLAKQVKPGVPTAIDLRLRHQKDSVTSKFTSVKVEYSYDGKTWTALDLKPTGADRYAAEVTHPAAHAGQAVHLRVDAQDEKGGRLQQEITAAYSLTK